MDTKRDHIEELKRRLPIVAVLQNLGIPVTHNRFRCYHPEGHTHGDRTPSVTVWPDRGLFKCWVCPQVKGDIFTLVQQVRGVGFPQAKEILEDWAGMKPPSPTGSRAPGANQRSSAPGPKPMPLETFFSPGFGAPGPGPADAPRRPPQSISAQPVPAAAPPPPPLDLELRQRVVDVLIELASPVRAGTPAARYLKGRGIFRQVWEGQKLRYIHDYGEVSDALHKHFTREQLARSGVGNAKGNLRYFKHPLLFPYYDLQGRPLYLQARAIEMGVQPKELSLAGPIPIPYNLAACKGPNRFLLLCEGIIDTLTLLQNGQSAVGVPGANSFKPEWAHFFKDKVVLMAFDNDTAGKAGIEKTHAILKQAGVEAKPLPIPEGKDINEWFRSGGLMWPEL